MQEVTEWAVHRCESDHAECGGVIYLHKSNHAECRNVYIFNSEYWGNKIQVEIMP